MTADFWAGEGINVGVAAGTDGAAGIASDERVGVGVTAGYCVAARQWSFSLIARSDGGLSVLGYHGISDGGKGLAGPNVDSRVARANSANELSILAGLAAGNAAESDSAKGAGMPGRGTEWVYDPNRNHRRPRKSG